MLDLDELSKLLHALLTGFHDRALNVVATSENLEDDARSDLWRIVESDAGPADKIRSIGDAMRRRGVDRSLVNEAYRAAFYSSEDDWQPLAKDPLFAFFSANDAGHVLDKWVHYFPIYTRHFAPFAGRPISLLEIGVYRGGSMRMWSRFFGPQARLVGMDIDPVAKSAAGDHYEVVLGDQTDPAALAAVAEQYGPFDVIIDDGGHTMEQQIASVEYLFPMALADGGIYLVEDCHTSYWSDYEGGRGRPGTFMEWAKERLDDINGYHQEDAVHATWTRELDAVHVYDSVVVLDRKHRFAPFSEQKGGAEFVFGTRPASIIASELVATRQVALSERDAMAAQVDDLRGQLADAERRAADGEYVRELETRLDSIREDLRGTRGELVALRPRLAKTQRNLETIEGELTTTRNKLLESWDHVREMRRSMSWRSTAPLRRLRGLR